MPSQESTSPPCESCVGGAPGGWETRITKPTPLSGTSCVLAMCGHLGVEQLGDAPAICPAELPSDLAGEAATKAKMNCHGGGEAEGS